MVPQNDPQDFRQIMSDYKTKVIHRGLLYLRTNISIVILARQFIWSNKLPSELLKSQQFIFKINRLPTQFTIFVVDSMYLASFQNGIYLLLILPTMTSSLA